MLYFQILLFLAGAFGVILFVIPMLQPHPTVQIGNVTGLACSLLAALGGLRLPEIISVVLALRRYAAGQALLLLLILSGLTIFSLALITGFCILTAPGKKPAENSVLLVLGCQVHGTVPSRTLLRRLAAAKHYLDLHPAARCIVCGGKGDGENITEARCMFTWLTGQGIDAARIYMEDRSTSTKENLRFAVPILEEISGRHSVDSVDSEERGSGLPLPSVAIVSSDYHLYRALLLAGRLGLQVGAVAAPTPFHLYPTYFVREQYGILYYWMRR